MIIDFCYAVLIIIACIKGYSRGLIVAVFSLLAFIVGLAAALKLSAVVAGRMQNSVSVSAQWMPVIAFAVVFIAVLLIARWGASLIDKAVKFVLLGWVNRLGGALLYCALYTLVFSICLFYAEKLQLLHKEMLQSSATYSFIKPWGPRIIGGLGQLIPWFKDMFTDLERFFDSISAKIQT